jgi:hypothetical protein
MDLLKFASKRGGIYLYRNRHSSVSASACVHIILSLAKQPHLCQGHLIFEVHISHTNTITHTNTYTRTHPVGVAAEASTYTTHNKHKNETSFRLVEFEPAIPAIKRPQTYTLDNTTTATCLYKYSDNFSNNVTVCLQELDAFPSSLFRRIL